MANEFLHIFLDELLDTLEQWGSCVEEAKTDQQEAFKVLFRCAHNLKGSAKSVGLTEVAKFIHEVEDFVTALRDARAPCNETALELLSQVGTELAAWERELRHDEKASGDTQRIVSSMRSILSSVSATGSAEGPIDRLLESLNAAQEGDIVWSFEPVSTAVGKLKPEFAPQSQAAEGGPQIAQVVSGGSEASVGKQPASKETMRVPRDTIEQVMNKLSEINSCVQRLIATKALSGEAAAEISTLASRAYDGLFSLILSPIGGVFRYLETVIQDVAQKTGKFVTVSVQGQECLVDKKTLERIKDPLMHIVRNAVDHGIETPEQRGALQKKQSGHIHLLARKTSTGVWLEIQDDGKGMDPAKLRTKAIEKGLIEAHVDLTPKECFQLILLPGFSTAAAVTEFSGRGVGMDVVKSSIDSINGRLEIDSRLGMGSRFQIFIPSQSSLLDMLIIEESGTQFAFAIDGVGEIVLANREAVDSNAAVGARFQFKDRSLPLFRLCQFFSKGINCSIRPSVAGLYYIIVLQVGGDWVAIQVDRIHGIARQLVQQIPPNMAEIPCVVGTTRLADGSPAFVLDVTERLSQKVQHAG